MEVNEIGKANGRVILPSSNWKRGHPMMKSKVNCLSSLPLFAVALLFMLSGFATDVAAQDTAHMPYLGHHYENTTLTLNLHGTALLKLYCGANNQFPCNGYVANIPRAAELASGSLPPGMHLTPTGDIDGMPSEAGDWYGTVRLPGYNVTSGGRRYDYGDMIIEFHLHVNYYCNSPNC
jgi:hypothetical protein